ncbi:MAG: hypothetical protein A2284_08600 [Deltaproteobacteria bacterium RIFOXYA12_FULL_61_11]|nr:MAG: hypothetical protein A2284_08600 [Deltaproteobacteria bacterium RIFOXYA12_FULL_61_11]
MTIVTGKGGVGKTTVAVALGMSLATAGHQVLLVEFDSQTGVGTLLGRSKLPTEPVELAPRFRAVNLLATDATERFLRRQLPLPLLFNLVAQSSALRSFLRATPGLDEMFLFGALDALLQEHPELDQVILDAPATGHGLTLLRIPYAFAQFVTFGGPRRLVEGVLAMLEQAQIYVVTLPEELPVSETLELATSLRRSIPVPLRKIVLNRCEEDPFDDEEFAFLRTNCRTAPAEEFLGAVTRWRNTLHRQSRQRDRLGVLGLPLVSLPALPGRDLDRAQLGLLAEVL